MLPTSQSKTLSILPSQDHTRRDDTDLLACPLTQVSSPLTCSSPAANRTTGAPAATVRSTQCAMDSANGSSLGAVQSHSMSVNRAITSFATVRCHRTLPSATVRISTSGSGVQRTIAASGQSLVSVPSGSHLATGCSPSTSEVNASSVLLFSI